MAIKKLNLDQTIFELGRKLKAHIKSGGDAHLPASDDNNGFMTTSQLTQLKRVYNGIYSGREALPQNTDILSLGPGFYVGYGFINHPGAASPSTPASWITLVDVDSGNDGRKKIEVTDSFTGYKWYRTIHTGGAPTSGTGDWVIIEGELTLWEGSSQLTSPVTFSQSLVNSNGTHSFTKIRVYYRSDYDQRGSVDAGFSGASINCTNLNNDANISAPDLMEAELKFTNTTAVCSRNVRTNLYNGKTDNTVYSRQEPGSINITKIVGVK